MLQVSTSRQNWNLDSLGPEAEQPWRQLRGSDTVEDRAEAPSTHTLKFLVLLAQRCGTQKGVRRQKLQRWQALTPGGASQRLRGRRRLSSRATSRSGGAAPETPLFSPAAHTTVKL